MEKNLQIIKYSNPYSLIFTQIAFIVLTLRGYFAIFFDNTIYITLFLNFVIAISFDYRHLKKSFFVFGCLCFLTVYNRDVLAIVDILAFIYLAKNINFSQLIRINLIVLTIYIVIWFFSLKIGVLKDDLMIMPKGIAHCLGYDNSNTAGALGFQIIASLFLGLPQRVRPVLIIIIPIVNELFFYFTIARTPWLASYCLLAIEILYIFRLIYPWMRYLVALLPMIIFGALIYFAMNINQYPELDILFTTRFSNYHNLLYSLSPINLLIGIPQTADIIVDSSYMMLLCSGGIFIVGLFWYKFAMAELQYWKVLVQYLPYIIATLALGIGENAFSSVSALSVIFWYLSFNASDLVPRSNYISNNISK